jgi:hypothetical protein
MNKISIILSVSLLLFLGACTKEISNNDGFTSYTGHELNDTAWIKTVTSSSPVYALADTIFQGTPIVDSIDLSRDQTLVYGDSLEVEISSNTLTTATGLFIDGKAKIEILRLKRKGDFIKAVRPTSSNGTILETAGAFFIRVSKNGTELSLAPGKTIKIRYVDFEAPKTYMQTFYGKESTPVPSSIIDTAHNWIPDADTSWLKPWYKTSGSNLKQGYILESKKLRWVSAAHALQNTKPTTNIYAILPPNFTNKNTYVFTVFDNSRTVLFLRSDFSSRSFMVGNIPIGTKLTLVSLSVIGHDYYLGVKSVNDVGTAINYSFTPEKKSLAQILEFINSL